MIIALIRRTAAGIVRDALGPNGEGVLRQVLEYPPSQKPDPLPACWFGAARAPQIMQGARSEWRWRLPLACAVDPSGMGEHEIAVLEAAADKIERAFDDHYTLGGLCEGMKLENYTEGPIQFADGTLIGFELGFLITERRDTSLSG